MEIDGIVRFYTLIIHPSEQCCLSRLLACNVHRALRKDNAPTTEQSTLPSAAGIVFIWMKGALVFSTNGPGSY